MTSCICRHTVRPVHWLPSISLLHILHRGSFYQNSLFPLPLISNSSQRLRMRGDALVLRPLPTNPQRCAPQCRIPKLPNEGIHNCKILSVSHQDSLPLQYGKPIMALSSESLISLIGVLVAIPIAAIVIVSLVKHFLKRPNTDHG